MFVIIKNILPKKSYTSETIINKDLGDKLKVYYKNYYSTNKLKTKRFQPKEAILPQKLEVTPELVRLMGLYFGDGQKSIKSKSYQAMRFSNSDPIVLDFFIRTLKSLNVKKLDLKIYIRASKLIDSSDEELINFWSDFLHIPKINFYKVTRIKSKHEYSVFCKKGTATVIYSNSSFRLVFDSMYNYIKNLSINDKAMASNFLKGIIAADGCVYYNKLHREVSIAAKKERDREYIRRLLTLLSILPNKDNLNPGKEQITITGYSNMILINKFSLCSLHPIKDKKFNTLLNSYKTICYRKGICKNKVLEILDNKDMSVSEISTILNRKENAIRRYLYILENESKIKRVSKKRTANTGRYCEIWGKI